MTMNRIQDCLSSYQSCYFLISPVIVSPVKAVVSLAQLVTGVAFTIIFGVPFFFTGGETLGKWTMSMSNHAASGLRNLIYSVLNFVTVGRIGSVVENLPQVSPTPAVIAAAAAPARA